MILQLLGEDVATTAFELVGLLLGASLAAGAAAVVFRWYAHDRLPEGIGILLGLTVVATLLNTSVGLRQAIVGRSGLLDPETAVYTVLAFVLAGIAADVARRAGDRLAVRTFAMTGGDIDDVTRLVTTGGRPLTVALPEAVSDVDGYDPVDSSTKEAIAGEELLFPRRLTVQELRDRLIGRLRDDYGVGAVDLQLAADGTVEYLAVGTRAAGLSRTIPPGSAAVAIRADPPFGASPGDLVQVWTTDGEPSRVVTGELRAAAAEVATLVVDEEDVSRLSPDRTYRLVTLPTEPRADREFAGLLRAAEETMATLTVDEGSPLVGTAVGALSVTVVAVERDGAVDAVPPTDRILAAGETLFVVATPAELRAVDASVAAPASADSTPEGPAAE